jgi:hypothetical protein
MSTKIKTITINAGVNPSFLENTLTEDVSTLACLFDLIDNSIDGARDHLLQSHHSVDKYGLPSSYAGYRIHIRIDQNSMRILDNCLGIDESTLSKKTFYTAQTSEHRFGIGHYGLGLKRSLLKVGSNYAMSTDTGHIAFKMNFDNTHFGGHSSKILTADAYTTRAKRRALFSVSNLKSSIKYEINSLDWYQNAIDELSVRYAIYIAKGLKITVRSIIHNSYEEIDGAIPTLRKNGKFLPAKTYVELEDVSVFIDSGIHQDYTFPKEENYSLSTNRTLTRKFGLYFICNDRVIVASSLSTEHGWKVAWHSEYNGFVCLVRFVSENSSRMPWNTAKTALRTDSTIFLKVRDKLQPIADDYRREIKKRYYVKSNVAQNLPAKPITEKPPSGAGTAQVKAPRNVFPAASDNRHLHPQNWTTLLPSNFPHSDDDILNAYVIEAIDLEIFSAPHASAMLYRSLIEAALKRFVKKTGNFQKVKDHFYLKGDGKGKNHSDEYKQSQGINIPMILGWLGDNENLFDKESRKNLSLALKKTREHVPVLNGVVHGVQLIDSDKLRTVRNETYELLRFIITKNMDMAVERFSSGFGTL